VRVTRADAARASGGRKRVVWTVVLLVSGLVVAGDGPAVAGSAGDAQVTEPTVVVGPDHVTDGQSVGVEVSSFPAGAGLGVQCLASVTAAVEDAGSLCGDLGPLWLAGSGPWQASWEVSVTFSPFGLAGQLSCSDDPVGCVVGALSFEDPDDWSSPVVAAGFDDITFGNALSVAPARELTDGSALTVSGADMDPGTWSVAQCGRAFVDDPTPTPTQAADLCGPATPVVVGPDHAFTAELVGHDPLVPAGGGEPLACGASGCVVVLSSPGDLATTSRGISFGGATVTLDPAGPYVKGTNVTLTVAGVPLGSLHTRLQQCIAPVGPTLAESRCDLGHLPVTALDNGEGSVATLLADGIYTDPLVYSCRDEPCVFAVFDESDRTLGVSAPFELQPPPTATLEPSTGLLDGQEVTLTARGLFPNAPHSAYWCGSGECDGVTHLMSAADGTLTATLRASQIPDIPRMRGYCRTACRVSLFPEAFGEAVELTWSMAEGSLVASPDTGLGDGDPVQITGTDLMPTYDGPTLGGFPTGGWALTQCDAAVLDDLSLPGVLTHCAAAPVTRPVTIEGATLSTGLEVRASITRILGGTTDCTATPGACVVGLARFDADAQMTTHLVPVDLAGTTG
jgi:hypothetical protein